METPFTPISALIGGALIGLAATLLYAGIGRIAGISGLLNHALEHREGRGWRLAFLAGLVIAAGGWFAWSSSVARSGFPWPWLIVAGLLVGMGTRIGNGCTAATASADWRVSPNAPCWPSWCSCRRASSPPPCCAMA